MLNRMRFASISSVWNSHGTGLKVGLGVKFSQQKRSDP